MAVDKSYPPLAVVNENDEPVGTATLQELHEQGLLHRVVWVIVQDSDGRVLLQQRGSEVATHPGFWDFSAAGHVDAGEDYQTAALRELQEEIGLTGVTLEELEYRPQHATYEGRQLNRFIKLFKVTVPAGTEIHHFQPGEVADVAWADIDTLAERLKGELADRVTPEFKKALQAYFLPQHEDHSNNPTS